MTAFTELFPRRLATVVLTLLAPCAVAHAGACETLAKQTAPTVSIESAEAFTGGRFTPSAGPAGPWMGGELTGLPGFCRVVVRFQPTPDSDIHAEIWLPLTTWNGKFLAVGSGGWGGSIDQQGLAEGLRRGYVTSATDDGHRGSGGAFVLGHPQKFIDFAYRAEHEMTVEAKVLIKTFYGRSPRYSYWQGCSGGGREGLLQAARYPEEFDGVIAGDPANVRRNAWALWLANRTFKDADARIPATKYPLIHSAVLAACDARDGVKDGLIDDPSACQVDFHALLCKAGDAPDCLTARQVESAQTIVTAPHLADGTKVFPRLEPGTELQWARLTGGPDPGELFLDQFRYLVYQDPNWDWRTFDLERDFVKANAVNRDVVELNPHLEAFTQRGGKLLIYHGWADQQVAPGSSVEFYQSAAALSSKPDRVGDWMRLFMVPGMGHCSGGEGPDHFDTLPVIEQWVEHGKAPDQIVAAHLTQASLKQARVDRTRPLCPYPQRARYVGSGSIDAAENFKCR